MVSRKILRQFGNAWEDSRGNFRFYVNDWPKYLGYSVRYYNSGNLMVVVKNGETISNYKATKLGIPQHRGSSGKVWLDEEGKAHIRDIAEAEKLKRILEAKVRAASRLEENYTKRKIEKRAQSKSTTKAAKPKTRTVT